MNKKIKDVDSYNEGVKDAIRILHQHFFAGNIEGGHAAITQLERMIVPVDNGVFAETRLPDSVPVEFIEPAEVFIEQG